MKQWTKAQESCNRIMTSLRGGSNITERTCLLIYYTLYKTVSCCFFIYFRRNSVYTVHYTYTVYNRYILGIIIIINILCCLFVAILPYLLYVTQNNDHFSSVKSAFLTYILLSGTAPEQPLSWNTNWMLMLIRRGSADVTVRARYFSSDRLSSLVNCFRKHKLPDRHMFSLKRLDVGWEFYFRSFFFLMILKMKNSSLNHLGWNPNTCTSLNGATKSKR